MNTTKRLLSIGTITSILLLSGCANITPKPTSFTDKNPTISKMNKAGKDVGKHQTLKQLPGITKKSTNNPESIEKEFIQSMIPSTKISKYEKSVIDGFYEVYFDNGQVIYVNPFKEVMFFGELVGKGGFNLTAAKRNEWKSELQNKLLKNTKADQLIRLAKKLEYNGGSQNGYSFVLFTDPQCPFCKDTEKLFAKNQSTVYINFHPLSIHKYAKKWSEEILSSKDFQRAFDSVLSGKELKNVIVTKQAKDTLQQMEALSKKLKVFSTPVTFVVDLKNQTVVDVINGANIPKIKQYLR